MSDSPLEDVRTKVSEVLKRGGQVTDADRQSAQVWLDAWSAAGGALDDSTAVVLQRVYGAKAAVKTVKVEKTRIDFSYLETFMYDTLVCYGVPEEEAKLAADVLIVADKRGIDSHGIGRLKPIYCDRFDQGIMKPTAPFTVVKETETCAVVDGGLGLGLVIGPKCMDMAIAKAKEHGLGMVVCRNSTHCKTAYYPLHTLPASTPCPPTTMPYPPATTPYPPATTHSPAARWRGLLLPVDGGEGWDDRHHRDERAAIDRPNVWCRCDAGYQPDDVGDAVRRRIPVCSRLRHVHQPERQDRKVRGMGRALPSSLTTVWMTDRRAQRTSALQPRHRCCAWMAHRHAHAHAHPPPYANTHPRRQV